MPIRVRAAEPSDRDALYEVCLLTGDAGRDATALYPDRSLLGDVFVGPYLALCPDLALVADDGTGAAGYALGALETGPVRAGLRAVMVARGQGASPGRSGRLR